MKKILLIVFIFVLGACTREYANFLDNIKGEYTLDSDTSKIILIDDEGDIYIDSIKTYNFDGAEDVFNAIYQNETTKMYVPFRISDLNLMKGEAVADKKEVNFYTVKDYATKKSS